MMINRGYMKKTLLMMIISFITTFVNIGFINAAIDNPIFFTRDNGLYSISQEGKEALIYDGKVEDFKLSPDRTKIAFNSGNNLYVFYLSGKTMKLISKDYYGGIGYPSGDRFNWLKNSESMLFMRNVDKEILKELYLYDIDRDKYSSLGKCSQREIDFEISPNGEKVMDIYCQSGAPFVNDLSIKDTVYKKYKTIISDITALGVFEALFINDEEIVYLLDKSYPMDDMDEKVSKRNLYHMNLTNDKKTLITVQKDILKVTGDKAWLCEKRELKISPDGRYFSYLFNNMVNIYDRRKRKLFLLSSKLPDITGYCWGPDGKTICCIDKDKFYFVTLDGKVTKVLNIPNGGFRIEW